MTPRLQTVWHFPGVGEFQCYDAFMLANLKACAVAAGVPEWGLSGPHDSGSYLSRPSDTGFFHDEEVRTCCTLLPRYAPHSRVADWLRCAGTAPAGSVANALRSLLPVLVFAPAAGARRSRVGGCRRGVPGHAGPAAGKAPCNSTANP